MTHLKGPDRCSHTQVLLHGLLLLLLLYLMPYAPTAECAHAPYVPRIPANWNKWEYTDKVMRFPHQPKIKLPPRLWSMQDLARGVAYANVAVLHPLLRKLGRGEPITVVALGSSVTSDCGGCFGSEERIQSLVEVMSSVYPQKKCGWQGWINHFMQNINKTWPHLDHVVINNGLPGATAKTYNFGSCVELSLPVEADLILMEHHASQEEATAVMENFLWRLNDHFNSLPPFILVNTMRMTNDPVEYKCIEDIRRCPDQCPHYSAPDVQGAFGTSGQQEDWLHSMAAYYGLAGSLSFRNWFNSVFRDRQHAKLNMSVCEYVGTVLVDPIHPTNVGKLLMADWLTYLLLEAEGSLKRASQAALGEEMQELSAAAQAEGDSSSSSSSSSSVENGSSSSDEMSSSSSSVENNCGISSSVGLSSENDFWLGSFDTPASMPRFPMTQGADAVYNMRCYGMLGGFLGSLKRPAGLDVQPGSSGFMYTEYQMHGTEKKYKPGYVTQKPGSKLIVKVDSYFEGTPSNQTASLGFGYLVSYEHMGKAVVTCLSGCECQPFTANGFRNKTRTSLVQVHEAPVSQHKECVIQVEVLDSTDDPGGETKFKVVQLTTKTKKKDVAAALRGDSPL